MANGKHKWREEYAIQDVSSSGHDPELVRVGFMSEVDGDPVECLFFTKADIAELGRHLDLVVYEKDAKL